MPEHPLGPEVRLLRLDLVDLLHPLVRRGLARHLLLLDLLHPLVLVDLMVRPHRLGLLVLVDLMVRLLLRDLVDRMDLLLLLHLELHLRQERLADRQDPLGLSVPLGRYLHYHLHYRRLRCPHSSQDTSLAFAVVGAPPAWTART